MSELGNRLREHARKRPDTPAVFARDRWWTYGELVAAADAIAGRLDVGPGDVVAIAIERGIEVVLAASAVALAGAVSAVVDPEDGELAQRTIAALRPKAAIARSGSIAGATTLDGAELTAGPPLGWTPVARPGLAYIIYTSGSTVDAKGVAWSESRAAFDWRADPPEHVDSAPSGVCVPLCTGMGIRDVLRTLHDGTSTVLLDVPFRVGLDQARALGVDRMRLTPTHVDVLLATTIELPALRKVMVSTAPISSKKLAALAARLPNARVARSYGLTESGSATTLWLDRYPKRGHTVGRAVGYRRITIRDAEGRILPPRTWGEVAIDLPVWDRGDGYVDASPELSRRFDNALLYTGDRGKLDGRGFLVLGARHAEILKVGGRSVSAPHIEEVLGGGRAACVVGVPERALGEVACVVYMPGADPAKLVAAAAALRADEAPRWYLPRWALPRTASGKLRRGRVALEAARWTNAFAQVVAPDHRTFPAFALDPRHAIVDCGIAPWFGDPGETARNGRIVALVTRRPVSVLALAYLQSGARGAPGARFAAGPFVAAQPDGEIARELVDVFAGELVRLVGLLPGPPQEHTYVRDGGSWRGRDDGALQLAPALVAELDRAAAAVQQLGDVPRI